MGTWKEEGYLCLHVAMMPQENLFQNHLHILDLKLKMHNWWGAQNVESCLIYIFNVELYFICIINQATCFACKRKYFLEQIRTSVTARDWVWYTCAYFWSQLFYIQCTIYDWLTLYSAFSKEGPLRASDRTFYKNSVKITGNHDMYVFYAWFLRVIIMSSSRK